MKFIYNSFLLVLCLISLANCRRNGGGPLGPGALSGAGPCGRCNQLRRDIANIGQNGIGPIGGGNVNAPFPSASVNPATSFNESFEEEGSDTFTSEPPDVARTSLATKSH